MNVTARCGSCGESFRVAELLVEGAAGRCPRCGLAFAPAYEAVLDLALHDLRTAADTLEGALRRVRETAPQLHVDVSTLLAAPGERL